MPVKSNKEEFIKKAVLLNGIKYDYSLVNYVNSKTKVKIICNKCSKMFLQKPNNHIERQNCPRCSVRKKPNFIENAIRLNGIKYDYSLVNYVNSKTKVKIICNKCSKILEQTPNKHLSGVQCSCFRSNKLKQEEFISRAISLNNSKYDYSLMEYKNIRIEVKIICNKCSEMFFQKPVIHLMGSGCQRCSHHPITTEEFIKKSIEINGKNEYNYDLVNCVNNYTKIKLKHNVCNTLFEQRPNAHLSKESGCPKCFGTKKPNIKEFIQKLNTIHNDKYDYSLVEYKNRNVKIRIICREHGVFEQTPRNHLNSQSGCPKCKSSKGEKKIRKFLIENNITFEEQKKFNELGNLRFDFCVYKNGEKILIEYDGIQHFEQRKVWEDLKIIQQRDKIKNEFAAKNDIELIRIPYTDYNNIEEILNKKAKKKAG